MKWVAEDFSNLRNDINRNSGRINGLDEKSEELEGDFQNFQDYSAGFHAQLQANIDGVVERFDGLESGLDGRLKGLRDEIYVTTDFFDKTKEGVYDLLAVQMDALVEEHNRDVVERHGIESIIGNNGWKLPNFTEDGKLTKKGAEKLYGLIERHEEVKSGIEDITYRVLDEGKSIAEYALDLQGLMGPVFIDHLEDNQRYRIYGGGESHYEAAKPDLLENLK